MRLWVFGKIEMSFVEKGGALEGTYSEISILIIYTFMLYNILYLSCVLNGYRSSVHKVTDSELKRKM